MVIMLAGLAPNLTKDAKVMTSGLLTARGVDSASTITLKTNGVRASMTGSFVPGTGGMGGSGFHLIGDKGWLAMTDSLFNPGKAIFSTTAGFEEIAPPPTKPNTVGRSKRLGFACEGGTSKVPVSRMT